jgi:hypothetical protein
MYSVPTYMSLLAGLRVQHMHTHPHGMLLPLITRTILLSTFLMAITAILDFQQFYLSSSNMDKTITYDEVATLVGVNILSLNPPENFEQIQVLCHHFE